MEDPVVQAAEEIFEKVEDVLPEVRFLSSFQLIIVISIFVILTKAIFLVKNVRQLARKKC